ncbi:unnamed protein product [Prunus armeniaca]
MTGPPSSSYPGQLPPPAVEISSENRREKLGFARNFAGFVLRRPAAIFGDQGFGRFWDRDSGHFRCARISISVPLESRMDIAYRIFSGFARIRRIVKRSPGYSGNANPGVRVLVTVRSCDPKYSRTDDDVKFYKEMEHMTTYNIGAQKTQRGSSNPLTTNT